ncbi:Do family serine endopeptidase [Bosea sp. (in: a-proteobacteria)]|uniref:Do family serine endopeptidase n=1 Tax=Bosea sp. (in: a-proteobacteria) TaxID=1871050 RepID=UPI00262282B4|nr:Do family serine endopeptidase [Bosea sp. (in: a-proteobacteria)]MCO5093449.1 Do family serine endopeptidase [Bosea sp. (in: a-proteobacteria)]
MIQRPSSFRKILAATALAGALTVAAAPWPALGQARQVPETREQMTLSFAPLVKQTAAAVVNVYGARVEKRPQNPFMDDPFFRRFFGDGGFGVPRERVQRSLGSGVIVDAAGGLVVTNNHVIENMSEVKVAFADKREVEATILLRDPRTDLAVLKLADAKNLTAIALADTDELQVGDIVLAMGNPFGVGQTVTQGIVSALARTQIGVGDAQSFIQTDAAINPGNSGGALIDMKGRVVGINTAIYSRSGGSVGIGFAIPSAMVRLVVDSARAGAKTVRRPWFGARLQALTADVADGLGLDRPAGSVVASVVDKGPAEQAGLRRSDVILSVDGVATDDPESFGYRYATRPIGGTTVLTVLRAGKRIPVSVKLVAAPESRPRDLIKLTSRSPLAGLTVGNMSPALAEELSVETGSEGVVVSEVEEGSTAANVGFQKGDLIKALNGEPMTNSREVEAMLKERRRAWEVTITRNGQTITSVFPG